MYRSHKNDDKGVKAYHHLEIFKSQRKIGRERIKVQGRDLQNTENKGDSMTIVFCLFNC